ncbi:hypothetical protein K523DRAFT_233173 [Schizophyllum commune Tattone D]|nr:hypothetical protein K523DRAFT_233173 [Schizophyllum commune Tattone D]
MDGNYEMNPALGRDGGLTGMDQDEELAEMNPNESSGSNSDDETQESNSEDGTPGLGGPQPASDSLLPAALGSALDIPYEDVEMVDLFATIDSVSSAELPETSSGLSMALLKLRKLGILPNGPLPTFWRALIPRVVPLGLPPLINRLPTELLSTIFAFLVEAELATESHAPVRLSHVCNTWRATALGDAALWAHVHVQECDGQRACAKRKVAELYMQRARMHPLEVVFSAMIGKPRRRPNACPCTLDLVLANMPRTRSLSLRWTRAYALPLLSRVAPADMARLDRLSVSLDHFASPYRSNIDLVAQLVASAPALRELYWRERVLPAGIPYARLTALALRRCPLNEGDVLRILRDAPALKLLEVSLFAAPSSSHPPLTHPALRSFGLAGEGARDGLFAALSFPALRQLWVGISELPSRALWPVRDAEVWLAFLGRMTRGLESLELSEVRMEEKTLLRSLMLPQLAGLRDLSVHGDTLIAGYDLFQFLRPDPAGSVAPALPNLRKLRLSLCDVGDGVVGQILQSRFEYGMPMSRVVIRFFGTCEEHSKDSAVFRQLSASRATKVYALQVLKSRDDGCKFFLRVHSRNQSDSPAPVHFNIGRGPYLEQILPKTASKT